MVAAAAVMVAVTVMAGAAVTVAAVTVDQENVDINPVRELLEVPRPLKVPGRGKQ